MSYRKGADAERRLIKLLREKGYECVRVAGSGRARFEQPDVLASDGGKVICIECKFVNKDVLYISREEIDALKRFARRFGCKPVLAVQFKKRWRFWEVEKLKGKGYIKLEPNQPSASSDI